jgi:bifunctional non-homologous end joining protein LigD
LVGVYKKGKFVYAGHVGGGFDQEGLKEMYQMLKKVITEKCPFLEEPHPNMPVTWVKPTLVCEVKFAEWTTDGMLRQPVFLGIRVDKSAKQVVRE